MIENNLKWYVLRAISGKENKVKEYIESALVTSSLFREYVSQVLIPTEKVVVLKNGKRSVKERNLLPGYVLVECNLTDECYPLLRNIPNVLGFLSESKSNTKPAPVPQSEINKIVGDVDVTEEELMMDETYMVGEKIKVTDGPFNGFNGVISEVLQDKHKLKVVVTIFDRQTPLELGFNQVEKE
ncbi:MAG: transcription termination/antitermination protein NusG [Paludibacteraceae bacterium]|nr:transcription termination/antitermination factor NusG [Candidatus Colicola equi]MCQ2328372.1 transcription termination/antitermination protein NusG [Paludibacteraceae bacterium]MCQ2339807.1 transcription termination/antitermination protein NusG [Paludibacteraceae bacterium]